MKHLTQMIIAALTASITTIVTLTACSHPQAQPAPRPVGQPFLPQLVHDLQSPPRPDQCQPQTLVDLMTQCDRP